MANKAKKKKVRRYDIIDILSAHMKELDKKGFLSQKKSKPERTLMDANIFLNFVREVRRRYGEGVVKSILGEINIRRNKY